MDIRPFHTSDLPALLHIYAQAKLDELQHEDACFQLLPLDQDPKRFDALMASYIYMVEIEGACVAYGAITDDELRALFVLPEHRGRGVASALLQHILGNLSNEVFLQVVKSNVAAKALYSGHGFAVTDEYLGAYNGVSVWVNKMTRAAE